MTTLAEQVAGLTVGEWVEAEINLSGDRFFIRGRVRKGIGDSLLIGEAQVIRYNTGAISAHLTSITRVPRPIPSEPGVGSFALLDDSDVSQMIYESSQLKHWRTGAGKWTSWPEIYPHIIRLYTPSGDEVTEFEYYKSEGN